MIVWLLLILTLLTAFFIQQQRFRWLPPSSSAMLLGIVAGVVSRLAGMAAPLRFSPGAFFYALLPPIVFQAGFAMKKRQVRSGGWWVGWRVGGVGESLRRRTALRLPRRLPAGLPTWPLCSPSHAVLCQQRRHPDVCGKQGRLTSGRRPGCCAPLSLLCLQQPGCQALPPSRPTTTSWHPYGTAGSGHLHLCPGVWVRHLPAGTAGHRAAQPPGRVALCGVPGIRWGGVGWGGGGALGGARAGWSAMCAAELRHAGGAWGTGWREGDLQGLSSHWMPCVAAPRVSPLTRVGDFVDRPGSNPGRAGRGRRAAAALQPRFWRIRAERVGGLPSSAAIPAGHARCPAFDCRCNCFRSCRTRCPSVLAHLASRAPLLLAVPWPSCCSAL